MALIDAMVVIPMDSGLAADSAVNTFKFSVGTSDDTSYNAIRSKLAIFYGKVQEHWSSVVNPTAVRLKLYAHGAPVPRAPLYDELLGLAAGTGVDELPSELAVCISYQAARVSGIPQARRRGRIFFGPLQKSVNANGRVYFLVVDDMVDAAKSMCEACIADPLLDWVIISGVPTALGDVGHVVNGWVDNAFDVQRRRGVDPTLRTTWVAS